MKTNRIVKNNGKTHTDKTDWKKIIIQSDSEINRNVATDPDSPILKNKKYYKPAKNQQSS